MVKHKCFCCEKVLKSCYPGVKDTYYDTCPSDGGWANLHFGYGSIYDDIECDGSLKGTTDMVIYICDECFKAKFKLVECWKINQPTPHGEKVKVKSPEQRGKYRHGAPNLENL